jgi:hypothetical protein
VGDGLEVEPAHHLGGITHDAAEGVVQADEGSVERHQRLAHGCVPERGLEHLGLLAGPLLRLAPTGHVPEDVEELDGASRFVQHQTGIALDPGPVAVGGAQAVLPIHVRIDIAAQQGSRIRREAFAIVRMDKVRPVRAEDGLRLVAELADRR